jgi:hypothetical protein
MRPARARRPASAHGILRPEPAVEYRSALTQGELDSCSDALGGPYRGLRVSPGYPQLPQLQWRFSYLPQGEPAPRGSSSGSSR